MVTPRDKCLRKLEELRALQASLTPFALKAAKGAKVTLHDCPPLTGEGVFDGTNSEVLGRYLSVSIEVARYERKLARLEEHHVEA